MKPWSSIAFLVVGGYLAGSGTAAAAVTKSIAHRGGSLFTPENTLAAFAYSVGKSDLVEFDVRVSSDGELVVMHDATVDRTTDGSGPVNAFTLAQLKTLDAGSWFSAAFAGESVPTLVEAVQSMLPLATPLIEHKAGAAQSYVDALQAMDATSKVILQSFDWDFLRDVHTLDPTIPLAALGSSVLTSNIVANVQTRGVGTIAWNKDNVTVTQVDLVHVAGMDLFVWTVNGPAVQSFVGLGVGGVISDDPALVRNIADGGPSANPILAGGLVSYWKLDDGLADAAASNALDVEGSNPGSLHGFDSPPSWTTGVQARAAGALLLDGTDDHVDIPQSDSLDISTNQVSISLWVKASKRPSALPERFGGIYDSVEDSYVIYFDRSNGELRFKITDANTHAARPGVPETAITTGRWHHVVGVFNGSAGPVSGQASIYLDGRLMDNHTGRDGGGGRGLTGNVRAGQHAAMGRNGSESVFWFPGIIDDVAIWRRSLSFGEVLQVFEAGTDSVPLQKSVMTIRITDLSVPSGLSHLQIRARSEHASMMEDELILESSHAVSGPYASEDIWNATALGDNEYLLSWPADNSTSKFFRIVNP